MIRDVRIKGGNRELPFYSTLLRMLEVQMATRVCQKEFGGLLR